MLGQKFVKTLAHGDKNFVTKCVRGQSCAITTSAAADLVEDVKRYEDIPSPPALPFLGHIHMFLNKDNAYDMSTFAKGLQAKYGNVVRLSLPGMGNGNMVMLFKPSDIQTMYSLDGRIPILPGFDVFEYARKVTMPDRFPTAGLISNKEDWYQVRSLVQQDMMRPKSATYYTGEMEEIAGEVVTNIEAGLAADGSFDINTICQQYALETVAYIFLGSRLGTLAPGESDGKRMIELQDESGPISQKLIFLPQWLLPYLPVYKKFIGLVHENMDICERHLSKAIANLTEDSETVLAKLVARCGKDSAIPLIMAIDSITAGIDTTGSTAAFLLYHLAANPDKAELLYREICDTIGPAGNLTEAALARMKYMKAVQMESQRILPAVWGTSRMYDRDVTIAGYSIPKGSTVVRCGTFSSMDSDSFPEPEQFRPERWLRGHEQRHTAHSFANLPFGHGARSCIGQRFARLELFTLMVKLVQTYRMEYVGDGEVGFHTRFVTVPDRQIKIKFTRRHS